MLGFKFGLKIFFSDKKHMFIADKGPLVLSSKHFKLKTINIV